MVKQIEKDLIEKSEKFYKNAIVRRTAEGNHAEARKDRHDFEKNGLGYHGVGHGRMAKKWGDHAEKRYGQAEKLKKRKNKMYPKNETENLVANILDENFVEATEQVKSILNSRSRDMVEAIKNDMFGLVEDEDVADGEVETGETEDTTETNTEVE